MINDLQPCQLIVLFLFSYNLEFLLFGLKKEQKSIAAARSCRNKESGVVGEHPYGLIHSSRAIGAQAHKKDEMRRRRQPERERRTAKSSIILLNGELGTLDGINPILRPKCRTNRDPRVSFLFRFPLASNPFSSLL